MLSFLRRNLAWMLLALILSTGLWLIVTIEQNPSESNWFSSVPVEVKDVPSSMALRSEVPPVRVRIGAPRDVWQARALTAEKFKASVDATMAGPGVTEVPVSVVSADSRAKVEEVDPPKVVLRLEPIRRKEVPVRVRTSGSVPVGFEARPARVTPSEVTVSGPQGLVEQVAYVLADVSLEGARTTISQAYTLVPQTGTGGVVERVALSAEKAVVEVPIVQELGYRTVSISPQVVGTVAFGYQVVGVMVDPVTTTVVGDPQALRDLAYLPTRPVDVSGAVGDVAVNAEPSLPAGVALARSQAFLVRVLVSPVEGSKTIEVAPQFRGAGDHLVTANPGAVRITVSGPMPVLSRLRPQDVQVLIDVAGLIGGTHNIRPTVNLPSVLTLVELSPTDIAVTVR